MLLPCGVFSHWHTEPVLLRRSVSWWYCYGGCPEVLVVGLPTPLSEAEQPLQGATALLGRQSSHMQHTGAPKEQAGLQAGQVFGLQAGSPLLWMSGQLWDGWVPNCL